jgi:hypothetical protein
MDFDEVEADEDSLPEILVHTTYAEAHKWRRNFAMHYP